MVVPEEREGKTDGSTLLNRDPSKASDTVSSRKAGGREPDNKDLRKVSCHSFLRSEHKRR